MGRHKHSRPFLSAAAKLRERMASAWAGFKADRSGMGAVEFAMIAPLLLMLYITAFEVTVGLSVAKRATRSAGAVADLVTQSSSVSTSDLQTMTDVVASIFAPYSTTGLSLQITGIAIDSSGNATVQWSWAQDGTAPFQKGAAYTLPADIATANSFLVHASVAIPHELLMFMPGLMPASVQTLTIGREYYFRQRIDDAVTCTNCPSG